jgi:hypothetical protein
MPTAVATASLSLTRWSAVSCQTGSSAAKYSPIGPPALASAAEGTARAGAAGSPDGSLYGSGAATAPRSGMRCTPSTQPVAPRSTRGVQWAHPSVRVVHSLAADGGEVP